MNIHFCLCITHILKICGCRNYRTEVEEDEGTVIYRTLLFHNSVFLGRCEKKMYLIFLLFFCVVL